MYVITVDMYNILNIINFYSLDPLHQLDAWRTSMMDHSINKTLHTLMRCISPLTSTIMVHQSSSHLVSKWTIQVVINELPTKMRIATLVDIKNRSNYTTCYVYNYMTVHVYSVMLPNL